MNFQSVYVTATNLDDVWHQLLYQLYHKGRRYKITSGSYEGHDRLRFDSVAGFIHNPHQRPLAPQMPPNSNLPAPTTDEKIEEYFTTYLMNSILAKNEHYNYATWIVGGEYQTYQLTEDNTSIPKNTFAPNQLEWCIDHFTEKGPGNEHCYITIGDPFINFAYNYPYKDETDRRTSPCLRGIDIKMIPSDEKDDQGRRIHYVHFFIYKRSWDLYSGFPTNMGGYTLLNEYFSAMLNDKLEKKGADWITVEGPLSFASGSLHAYDFQVEIIKQRLGKN